MHTHAGRAVTINKHKALDDCLLDCFVCVCVAFSFSAVLPYVQALDTAACVCCLSVPALTLNQQIGINKADMLLVPGKGQRLSKQFLFDTACSENSMLG